MTRTNARGAERPRLLFIHGASGPKARSKWLDPLNGRLEELGVSPLAPTDVVEIDYTSFLRKRAISVSKPEVREVDSTTERELEFEKNRDRLGVLLAPLARRRTPVGRKVPKAVSKRLAITARYVGFKKTARRYLGRRDAVTAHIRDEAGDGPLIVVDYSLGSVVAADLLPVLRADQHVRLVLTVGSPLGQRGVWKRTARSCDPFPKDRVDAWVNIYNTSDGIAGYVGLSSRFPDVVDVPIGRFGKRFPRALPTRPGGPEQVRGQTQELRKWVRHSTGSRGTQGTRPSLQPSLGRWARSIQPFTTMQEHDRG